MAMHLNENLDDNGEMHDINVTPFIDVMLDTLHQAGYLKIGLVGEETAKAK